MRKILSLRRHHYLKTVSIFLIAVLLIVGVVSCEGEGEDQYNLTVSSTAGGHVDIPGEGTYTYDEGTVQGLRAIPDCGYAFDKWTGDTTNIGDVNAAFTGIGMYADYSITANFKPIPPDHYKFYYVDWEEPEYINKEVQLVDQFGTFDATVLEAWFFGNPVEKEHATAVTSIKDEDRHYTVYKLDSWYEEEDWVTREVEVSNQFDDAAEPQTVTVMGPVALAVPTKKGDHEMVECLNHYLLYLVSEDDWAGFSPVEGVNLKDQFILNGEDVTVKGPMFFANPVKKTVVGGNVSEVEDDELHWLLYDITEAQTTSIDKQIQIANQFGNATLDLTYREMLAVPSVKNVPPTPELDHFKCYMTSDPSALQEWVTLLDQFHYNYFEGLVMEPIMFCNPVDKVHGTVTTSSNPDNHLTVYKITETTTDWWTVTINNQFNDAGAYQTLTVFGPVALAVPTQKLVPGDHGLPKYIDHYLLYQVWEPEPVNVNVDLDDQFPGVATNVTVGPPIYFANPCLKGYIDWTGIWDPEEHLLFYAISDNPEFYSDDIMIKNQFCFEEPCYLDLIPVGQLLAVPSVKENWAPTEPPLPP